MRELGQGKSRRVKSGGHVARGPEREGSVERKERINVEVIERGGHTKLWARRL